MKGLDMYAIVSTGGKQYKVAKGDVIDEKKLVFKFKKRKRYHRTKGHRQNLTKLQVVEIPA